MKDKITAILLDDMQSANKELAYMLEMHHPEVEIVGIFEDVQKAVWSIITTSPDVIFLDICMPEMSGFEVFALLSKLHIKIQCVIVSAYLPEYDSKKIDTMFDLKLDKPVDEDDLKNILDILHVRKDLGEYTNFGRILSTLNIKKKVAFPVHNGTIFINPYDIIYVQAHGKYSLAWIIDYPEQPVEIKASIKAVHSISQYPDLFEAHRSYLFNLNLIKNLDDALTTLSMHNGNKKDIIIDLESKPSAFQRVKQQKVKLREH